MDLAGLIVIAGGVASICGAAFGWDWLIHSRDSRFLVNILGRLGARLFYGVLGLVLVVAGVLMLLGVLDGSG